MLTMHFLPFMSCKLRATCIALLRGCMWRCTGTRDSLLSRGDRMSQNHTRVILRGVQGASLHPVARAGAVPGTRSRDLLPREGRLIEGGETDLYRLPRSHRMPELRPSSRSAVRGVGRYERTRTTTLE